MQQHSPVELERGSASIRAAAHRVYLARSALERADVAADPAQRASARAEAMREAGLALAVDPACVTAAEIVASILARPPEVLPDDAARALREREAELRRDGVKLLALRVATWLALAWMPFAMPVLEPTAAGAIVALFVGLAALTSAAAWSGSVSRTVRRLLLVAGLVACASLSGMFGPFVLVPAFVATTTVLHALLEDRRERALVVSIGVLAVLAPFGLELAGVLPPSMAIADGSLVLLPRVVSITPVAGLGFLAIASTLVVVTPALAAGRMRDALLDAEARLAVAGYYLTRVRGEGRAAHDGARAT